MAIKTLCFNCNLEKSFILKRSMANTAVVSARVPYALALKIKMLSKKKRESVNDWSKRALAIVAHYTEPL